MPMSNLKYQLKVKDKYKHWFPLEDPTPYWEEVNKRLKDRFKTIENDSDPYVHVDFLIEVIKKTIEFNTNIPVVTTPADRNPSFYVVIHLFDLQFFNSDVVYYYVQILMQNEWDTDVGFLTKLADALASMKESSYIPLDNFTRKRIQKEYYHYVKSYEPSLESYKLKFG